jgi:hypothetical protein
MEGMLREILDKGVLEIPSGGRLRLTLLSYVPLKREKGTLRGIWGAKRH